MSQNVKVERGVRWSLRAGGAIRLRGGVAWMVFAVLVVVLGGGCGGQPAGMVSDSAIGDRLEVFINDEGPFRFGIDTGQSTPAVISPAVAARLGLPVLQTIRASDGVSDKSVDVVGVRSLRLAGEERLGTHALVLPLAHEERDGALGAPFFEGLLLEYDYPAGRVRVRRGSLGAPDGATTVGVRLEHSIPHIMVDVEGERIEAILDTGSEGGLLLPMALRDVVPLAGPVVKSGRMQTLFGEFDVWSGRVRGEVRIGSVVFSDPPVSFSEYFREANVGRGFLSGLTVVFDPANARVRLTRRGTEGAERS